jgi:alkanesulfonate monooxygenase SsuD/methylene tetrahydromethanopterin reductase-like flavin-dependent oxidoreductase (luciferase family)
MRFSVRFDFRDPRPGPGSMADRYAAALDMVEWADGRPECGSIILSEHHGAADGYLPAPLPMLGAMAARTSRVTLRVAALIAPFHDPLRLAEDLVVLDHLSRGRVELVVGAGYVADEFAMFGVEPGDRVRRVVEAVTTVKAAMSGEPFDYRGRRVRVTPGPYSPGGPVVALGGGTPRAARRAARIADDFEPTDPRLRADYRAAVMELGRPDPGPLTAPSRGLVVLAEDPEEGWARHGEHLLHEMNSYGRWTAAAGGTGTMYRAVTDLADLRASGRYRILTPAQLVAEIAADPDRVIAFHPLCGGTPPALGWASLHLLDQVIPAPRPAPV